MLLLTSLLGAVFIGCIVYIGLTLLYKRKVLISRRLRMTKAANISGSLDGDANLSLSDRMIKPTITRVLNFFSMLIPMSPASLDKLTAQLSQAEIRMSAKNYNAAVLLFTLFCALLFAFIGRLLGKPLLASCLIGLLGVYAGMVICRFHLKRKIKLRRDEIYHQMPDALDLLSVSVSAGLGFDQALSYVVKKSKGALIREFDTTQREISLGRSRKEAMERLAERCGSIEINTFVSAILQADEMGASIKNVLQIQASTIRETHRQNVEEKMQKLSVKMLIPMVLFIFPVLLIVLLGPAVPTVIDALSSI